MLSWNAGHLGAQQWAEVKAWLHTGASDSCDLPALQETHWNETAEFTVEGWQCVSSAKLTGLGAPRHPCQGHAVVGGRLQRPAAYLQHSQAKYGVRDESFQRFVESHRLVALNTWSSGRGHTYVQGDARTQIDHIFTFPNSSRGQAKQAKPAPQLGLGGWKKGGHIPNSGAQVMTPSASFETQTEVRETPFTSRTGENPTAYLVSCEARESGPG
eukprot:s2836_g6.t1